MKRFTMILALVLMVTMPMMAERVPFETARQVAMTFFSNNGSKDGQLTDLTKVAGFSNLYIFTNGQGFVVMAADNCVQPILGYSLSGAFVAEDMPDNVRDWLQGYNDEIQYAIDSKMSASAETTQLWKDLTDGDSKAAKATPVVNNLLSTTWDQNPRYNKLCPYSNYYNQLTVTGCVATAMAQIMKFWGYPSHGIGSHSYTHTAYIDSNNNYHDAMGYLFADFGATTYQWENMPAFLSSASSQSQIEAIATLMYHCGVSVDMDYGVSGIGGSGAQTANVAKALQNYFNYQPCTFKYKSDYQDDWIDMLKTELNASRPLQYSGRGPDGGHSFVCCGYDNNNNFYFNWGWSGGCDGFFALTALYPESGGAGSAGLSFNDNQGAIFGIQPVRCAASEPTNLTYTLNGLQDLTLNWTAATNATSYNIYRNGNYVGNSTTNSYSETAPFGENEYYVRSVDADGNLSLSSNTVSLYIGYQTPVVDDLTGTLSESTVTLSWTAPEWCYPETPSATLNYGSGDVYYSWSSTYYAHRHLATNLAQYAGKAVYKVSTYIEYPGTYSLYVYSKSKTNGQPDPNSLVANFNQIPVTISNNWYEFVLNAPVILTGTDDLWVVIKQENTGQTFAAPSFNLTAFNENACYFGSSSPTSLSSIHIVQGQEFLISWLINVYLTDGTYTYNLYQDGARIAQNLTQTTSSASLNNNAANVFTVRTNYYDGETDDSNMVGFTKGVVSLNTLEMTLNDKMTVTEGSKLTVSGTLSNSVAVNLILENGAQLINDSEDVKATVKKTISPYTEDLNDGWHLIASPVTENITPTADNGLLTNEYDLYMFNQSEEREWRNYEADPKPFSSIDNKVGYLYANSGTQTLAFAGTLATNVDPTSLSYDENAYFAGFNLIGNPYPCNAYIERSFYVLNYNADSDSTKFVLVDNDTPIAPCAAVLVQAQEEGESVTFSKTAPPTSSKIAVRLNQADQKGASDIDQVRIMFQQQHQLAKYPQENSTSTIYIPQNGKKLAVANAEGLTELPINLRTAKNGSYTLSFETEKLDLNYLHLIDNMTGNDVDLLVTPSYTFEGKTADYESRFRLVFATNCEDADDDDETFAYVSNGEIVITGVGDACNASLQIVDMTGRVIRCLDVARNVSTSGMTAGVYVLRLINGDDVKTQKIVIE